MENEKKQKVSIIIPTLNGGSRFQEVLASLQDQTLVPDEIIVIDSESDDGTADIARSFNVRVETIARSEFDHGGTRAAAARMSGGDILVYITQDAVAADANALKNLVAPLQEEKIAASYGRQLPCADATCFAKHLRLFNYPENSWVRCWEDRKTYGFKTAFISNSFAAYKKNYLESVGFFESDMIFGEDTFTVAKLLDKGYCVAYVAGAMVVHSHNYSVFQEFRRYFDIGVFHADQQKLLELFGSPLGEGKKYVYSEMSQLVSNKEMSKIAESLVRNGLKFIAYKMGKKYTMLPRRLAVFCSLNRGWWQ